MAGKTVTENNVDLVQIAPTDAFRAASLSRRWKMHWPSLDVVRIDKTVSQHEYEAVVYRQLDRGYSKLQLPDDMEMRLLLTGGSRWELYGRPQAKRDAEYAVNQARRLPTDHVEQIATIGEPGGGNDD